MKRSILAAFVLAPVTAWAQPVSVPVTPEMVTAPRDAGVMLDAARAERLVKEEQERREREQPPPTRPLRGLLRTSGL